MHKNQHIQRKLLNCELWINGELSKIVIIFFLNDSITKCQCAPKLVFFNGKELRKKFVFVSQILTLFGTSTLIQNSKFNNFLLVCWFLCKNLSNFVPPLENSTTHITIFSGQEEIRYSNGTLKTVLWIIFPKASVFSVLNSDRNYFKESRRQCTPVEFY